MRMIKILLYHRVENLTEDFNMLAVSPENFRAHMTYLAENYRILDLNENISDWFQEGTEDAVIVTFDDGYYDWVYHALPILKQYGIPATMFVATGNVGTEKEFWTDNLHRNILAGRNHKDFFHLKTDYFDVKWPTKTLQQRVELYQYLRRLLQISPPDEKRLYLRKLSQWSGCPEIGRDNRRSLTEKEIQILASADGISIGAHTVTHPSLKWMTKEEQWYEISESRKYFEQLINKKGDLFSYPFGTADDFSDVTVDILKEVGFEKAVVGYPGDIDAESNLYTLPRYTIRNYDQEDFVKYMDFIFSKGNQICMEKECGVGKIGYMGSIENDVQVLKGNENILIWGTGYCGEELYSWILRNGLQEKLIGFGDNDVSKTGTCFMGYSVYGIDQLRQREPFIILTKGQYAREISKQLCDCKTGIIHWII